MVVALVVGLVVAMAGGSDGPLGGLGVGGDAPAVPAFSFEASEPVVITTVRNPNPEAPERTAAQIQAAEKKAVRAATPAADAAVELLDTYYTAAFLDPGAWQDAAYDDVFAGFTNQARDEAGSQLEIMSAGSEAGFAYDTIEPMPSVVRTKVLLDPNGAPASVVGITNFQATGDGSSGSHLFVSKGQFVLQKIDGEWTIVSFSVTRSDKDRGAKDDGPASGSASPSASGSSS